MTQNVLLYGEAFHRLSVFGEFLHVIVAKDNNNIKENNESGYVCSTHSIWLASTCCMLACVFPACFPLHRCAQASVPLIRMPSKFVGGK